MDATQSLVPNHPGVGSLVPVEGRDLTEEKLRQKQKFEIDDNFTRFLLDLKKKCSDRQESAWRDIKKQMVRCRQYNDGKQYGDVNDKFEWVDLDVGRGEVVFFENMFHKHVKAAMTELTKANPVLNFTHTGGESRKGKELAEFCSGRWQDYQARLFTPVQRHYEKLSGVLNGVSARYTFFEFDEQNDNRPVFSAEPQEMAESVEVCATCYAPKKGDTCNVCGDDEFETIGDAQAAQTIEMKQERPKGRNKCVNVDPLGLTFDLLAPTVADSPYIGWEQLVMDEVLQHKYPDVELSSDISPELVAGTGESTPGGNYLGGQKQPGKQFSQWWFDYALYADIKPNRDVKLRNGKVLPKGEPLGESFPKGLYVGYSGDKILDVWGEDKDRKWSIAPYIMRIGTLVGMGSTAMLSQQDRKNDIVNLKMAVLNRDAFRQEFLNSKYIKNDDMPDDPRMRAEIHNLPDNVRIVGGAVDVLPPSGLSPIVSETEEQIESATQALMGTFAPSAGPGMSDMKGLKDTLGGVQMLRESTVSGFGPSLEIQAYLLDVQQAYQLLENDQEYLAPEQWEEIAGDYGLEMVQEFLNCDIRDEILIEVVKECYMPQTKSQQQANLQGYIGIAGALIETGQDKPERMAQIAEVFNQPESLGEFDQNYAAAYAVIRIFTEIAENILQMAEETKLVQLKMANPTAYVQLVLMSIAEADQPVNAEMQDHAAMINAFRDFWNTDKGRAAPVILKDMIDARVEEHLAAEVAKAQSDMARSIAAQAPAMEQEQMMQQQQMEAQAPQMEAEQEGAVLEGMASMAEADAAREHEQGLKQADLEEAEKGRQHDATQKELDRRHQSELAEKQAKQQAKAKK